MARALVIGASGGIGQAVVQALRARGDTVVTLSRRDDGLDVTDAASVAAVLGGVDGPFEMIFVAVGVLGVPEKSLDAIKAGAMAQVFAVNAIGPALILRHLPRLLPRQGRSVCAVLSARVGSIGDNAIGGWYSYRASKAALNQIVHGAAVEVGRSHKDSIVVALHPGTVDTPFTANYTGRHKTVTANNAAGNLLGVMDGLTVDQSGGFFDYAGRVVPW
ncbi:SDR family NAD(P)-dependent oxidoreductase [Loktanella salsilacus]|uniref:SDR family NAD(P)-dependent oxidoreductase n=1 Tax=Loktanella salsilacus TaxID=195913 RepID=UPI003735DE0C